MYSQSISNDDRNELPLEHMFKAICSMQSIGELDDITSSLVERMSDIFMTIPEKKGLRKYGKLVYYPNGLIDWPGYSSAYNNAYVAARPWERVDSVKERGYNLKTIKHYNELWYYQIMLYQKRIIRKPSAYGENTCLAKTLKMLDAMEILSKKQCEVAGIYIAQDTVYRAYNTITGLFKERYAYSYEEKVPVFFLTEGEIKHILKIYDTYYNKLNPSEHNHKLYNTFVEYVNSIKNTTTNLIHISTKQTKEPSHIAKPGSSWADQENPKFVQELRKQLIDIYKTLYAIKDPAIRNVLIKLEIIEEGYDGTTSIADTIQAVQSV